MHPRRSTERGTAVTNVEIPIWHLIAWAESTVAIANITKAASMLIIIGPVASVLVVSVSYHAIIDAIAIHLVIIWMHGLHVNWLLVRHLTYCWLIEIHITGIVHHLVCVVHQLVLIKHGGYISIITLYLRWLLLM